MYMVWGVFIHVETEKNLNFFVQEMASRQPFSSNSKPTMFLAITICASLVVLSAILYFLYYLWRFLVKKSRTSPFECSTSPLKLNSNLRRFSYKELRKATRNFGDSNSIGRGGSGTVFRGRLKDGKLVAVKLLDSRSFQCEEEFRNELKILGGIKTSPFVVSLLGFCVENGSRLVVFEYMPNRSLQECLFSETRNGNSSGSSLSWSTRFAIILDVAKALAFLHLDCEPAVIHGDVKPSNVLLDSQFRAKISDFGLSRMKLDETFGQDMGRTPNFWQSQDLSVNSCVGGGGGTTLESLENDEVDFAFAVQPSNSPYGNSLNFSCNADQEMGKNWENVKGKELSGTENGGEDWNICVPYDDELSSMDHSKELNSNSNSGWARAHDSATEEAKQWGKDWWWRQDGDGELSSKDYVMEWIGSQIYPSTNPYWDEENQVTKVDEHEKPENQPIQELVEKTESKRWKVLVKKHMKMHEWWKQENLDELRQKKGTKLPHFGLEFSAKKGWRKKKENPSPSSEILSRELSSTTSMRGTLCYVAPEYGGMEKADIYSFGVLILVIVSGRRPLHVLSSPMKLEKANLISWCRHLAQSGSVLELVDERVREEYSKDEAAVCISLALACLQKSPELRPNIADVVKILEGELEPPSLPFDFSPSPRGRLGKPRKGNGDSSSAIKSGM